MNHYEKRVNFLQTEVMTKVMQIAELEKELSTMMAQNFELEKTESLYEKIMLGLYDVAETISSLIGQEIGLESVEQALNYIGYLTGTYQKASVKFADVMDITLEESENRKVQTYTLRNCTSVECFYKKLKEYGFAVEDKSADLETMETLVCTGLDMASVVVGADGMASGSIVYVYDI